MYVYKHTNGKFIKKRDEIVELNTFPEEYFDSPYVMEWWKFDTEKEADIFIEQN